MLTDNVQYAHQLEQLPPGPIGPQAVPVTMAQQQQHDQQQQQQQKEKSSHMDRELEALLIEEGLDAGNIAKLSESGFTQQKILKRMSEGDMREIGITPLGQRKLLEGIIQSISTPSPVNPSRQTTTPAPPVTTDSTCRQLEELFRSLPSTASSTSHQQQQQPINTAGEVATVNPFYHLLPPNKVKYHQIVKFLHIGEDEKEEEEVWGDGQRKLVFKAGTKATTLQYVSPMQWCGANVRIMMELLREGSLTIHSIPDYLAYTAKISDLAAVYQWGSVLQFDDLYRKMQAQNGFRWGSESPHVDRLCLKFKEKEKKPTPAEKKGSRLCINYQYKQCKRGDSCSYRHVCSAPGCGKNHGLADHEKYLNQ